MIRILFCTERWYGVNPSMPLTNSFHNLFGSLKSTGLAEFEHIHYDEYAHTHNGERCDNYLLECCEKQKPDIVFFSYYMPAHWGQMLPETLAKIKEMGIKTIFIWWDNTACHIDPRHVDLSINIFDDRNTNFWTPQDPTIFNNPNKERDIDVSFLGTMYRDRICYCGTLVSHFGDKIKIFMGGSQRGNYLTPEAYADIYQRSKIVLNFCNGGMGPQIKGRVYEAMFCGALLLEQNNHQTERFFTPMEHYVPFFSPPNMCERIEYYLAHEEERLKIAKQGQEKCDNDYSAKKWWSKLINYVLPASINTS